MILKLYSITNYIPTVKFRFTLFFNWQVHPWVPIRIRQNDADLTGSGFITLTKVKVIHFYGMLRLEVLLFTIS
jgi:hypothetical protein